MGLMDKAMQRREELIGNREASAAAAAQVTSACPGQHYATDVNKGSINMTTWAGKLNEWYQKGYRLAQVYEQSGNTVQVFEHHFH